VTKRGKKLSNNHEEKRCRDIKPLKIVLILIVFVFLFFAVNAEVKELGFISQKLMIFDNNMTNLTVSVYNSTWLEFDGVDDYVEVYNNGDLDFNNQSKYTFSAWVYLVDDRKTIYSQGKLATKGISMFAGNGSRGFGLVNQKDNTIYRVNGIKNNTWTHILCTYDGMKKEIKCYMNGKLMQETGNDFNWSNVVDSRNSEVRLGNVLGSGAYFNGSLKELGFFNRVLSASEITDLYQSKKGESYSFNRSSATFNSSPIYMYNDTRYYALIDSYLKKSDDGGKTWTNVRLLTKSTETIFIDSKKNIFLTTIETGNISRSNMGNDGEWEEISVMSCQNKEGEGWGYGVEWGFTETKEGTLLLGEYGNINASKRSCAFIHRSTDNGLTWEVTYNGKEQFPESPGRHIHLVRTDPYTGYIYATQGDTPDSILLRSIDDGKTWNLIEKLSDTSQYLSLVFTPEYRIFGTDKWKGNKIIRTKDDEVFEEVYVLPSYADGYFWDMEREDKTGIIIAGTQTTGPGKYSMIVISTDEGSIWTPVYEKMQDKSYKGLTEISYFNSEGYSYYYDNDLKTSFYFNLPSYQKYFGELSFNFNENSGATAYDSSGNNNHGTIYGATWKNDGVMKTLKEGIDYEFNEETKELVPSDKYLYTWFNVTYFSNNTNNPPPNDTTPPIITSTYPTEGFATGTFEIRFIEENPKELILIYGNETDLRGESIDLDSCTKEGGETYCNIDVNLSEFRGQEITYYFYLEDIAGNYDESEEISLEVENDNPPINDTIPPRITSTSPTSGFATGTFEVEFVEENPEKLQIIYGNETDLRGESINLDNCVREGEESICSIESNLSEFDGQEITYYFHLEDEAGNYDESEKVNIEADVFPPILNNLEYSVSFRMVSFIFNVSEPNFDRIKYTDIRNGVTESSGILCWELEDGICSRTKWIRRGDHIFKIEILDKAGHNNSFEVEAWTR